MGTPFHDKNEGHEAWRDEVLIMDWRSMTKRY